MSLEGVQKIAGYRFSYCETDYSMYSEPKQSVADESSVGAKSEGQNAVYVTIKTDIKLAPVERRPS